MFKRNTYQASDMLDTRTKRGKLLSKTGRYTGFAVFFMLLLISSTFARGGEAHAAKTDQTPTQALSIGTSQIESSTLCFGIQWDSSVSLPDASSVYYHIAVSYAPNMHKAFTYTNVNITQGSINSAETICNTLDSTTGDRYFQIEVRSSTDQSLLYWSNIAGIRKFPDGSIQPLCSNDVSSGCLTADSNSSSDTADASGASDTIDQSGDLGFTDDPTG